MTYPDTILFETAGREHIAVVGLPVRPTADAMVHEQDGVQYAIYIPFGEIPGYPEATYIARPIENSV